MVHVSSNWSSSVSSFDSYTVQTFLHEIGHALGLGHQGLYNGSGTYATNALFSNDSWQVSMMSYFSQTDNSTTGSSYGYGIANAFRGDTVYGVGTTISAAVSRLWNEFSVYIDTTAYTIVDASGYDILDVSNFSVDQHIDLAPSQPGSSRPSLSDIGGKIGNLAIAAGTLLEAAIGGAGNDSFSGNDSANTFHGGGGGDDLFLDSLGSDIYFGDAGLDALRFQESLDHFRIELSGDSLLLSRLTGSSEIGRAHV